MPGQLIRFDYKSKSYTVPMIVFDEGKRIVLPNGIVLRVEGWNEMDPPRPIRLVKMNHLFEHLSADQIAIYMNGVVASPA